MRRTPLCLQFRQRFPRFRAGLVLQADPADAPAVAATNIRLHPSVSFRSTALHEILGHARCP